MTSSVGEPCFIALDTETTGTDPHRDRIIELAMAGVNAHGCLLASTTWRFNPGTPIPEAATAIHGIRDEDVHDKPPFAEAAAQVQAALDGAVVIAYNGLAFDLPLLDAELRRSGQSGLPPGAAFIDPYLDFRDDTPRSLTDAARFYLGRMHPDAHQAAADVAVMLDVLRVQAARRGTGEIRDLVRRDGHDWITWGGYLVRIDGDARPRLGFGKYEGHLAEEHPSYLEWMLNQDFPRDTLRVVASILGRGHEFGEACP